MQMPDDPRRWIEAAIRDRETNSAHALEQVREAEALVNQTLEARGQKPPLTEAVEAMAAIAPDLDASTLEVHVDGMQGWHAELDKQVLDMLGRVFLGCDQLDWDLTPAMRDFRTSHKL